MLSKKKEGRKSPARVNFFLEVRQDIPWRKGHKGAG